MKTIIIAVLFTVALPVWAATPGFDTDFINQLAAIAHDRTTERSLSEITDLSEKSVKLMQLEYFRINEDYTDFILGDKLRQIIEYLMQISQNNENIYLTKLDIAQRQQQEIMRRKDQANAWMQDKIQERNELNDEMAGKADRLLQLDKDKSWAEERYHEEEKKYKKKNSFWHGFATGISFGIYNVFAELDKISDRLNNINKEIDKLKAERTNLQAELDQLNNDVAKVEMDIITYQRQMSKYSSQINKITINKQHYSNIREFFGSTATSLKYTDISVKGVLNELSSIRNRLSTPYSDEDIWCNNRARQKVGQRLELLKKRLSNYSKHILQSTYRFPT